MEWQEVLLVALAVTLVLYLIVRLSGADNKEGMERDIYQADSRGIARKADISPYTISYPYL